jgi:coenzyme Q-binding protein COQ10
LPHFRTTRRIAHSAAEMFDLVADVERYPEFVPLCEGLRVIGRRQEGETEIVLARMTIAYKLIREAFISEVRLDRAAGEIRVQYQDGPFKSLDNLWTFRPLGEQACEVGFSISYEFRSRMLQMLMGAMFDRAFRKFADAFEARADAVYGRKGASRPTDAV